ncbi:MAG: hypothetical protein KDB65_07790 [Calditrichaeota bacterium]|nr:hypothetical protein [Calditrichota bacterium]MCB9369372.1 hypothetical protein [Calditrichota bacterium]
MKADRTSHFVLILIVTAIIGGTAKAQPLDGKISIVKPSESDTLVAGSFVTIEILWTLHDTPENKSRETVERYCEAANNVDSTDLEIVSIGLSNRNESQEVLGSSWTEVSKNKNGYLNCLCESFKETHDSSRPLSQSGIAYNVHFQLPEECDEDKLVLKIEHSADWTTSSAAEQAYWIRNPRTREDSTSVLVSQISAAKLNSDKKRIVTLGWEAENRGWLIDKSLISYSPGESAEIAELGLLQFDRRWRQAGFIREQIERCGFPGIGNSNPYPEDPAEQRGYYLIERAKLLHHALLPQELPCMRLVLDDNFEMVEDRAVYRTYPGFVHQAELWWQFRPMAYVYEFATGFEAYSPKGNLSVTAATSFDLNGTYENFEATDSILQAVELQGWQKRGMEDSNRSCLIRPYAYVRNRTFSAVEDMVDRYVRLVASYTDPDGWSVSDSLFIQVVHPETRDDYEKWFSHELHDLRNKGEFERAVALVDSLANQDYYFPDAMVYGWMSAEAIKDHKSALRFIDCAWEYNGYFEGNGYVPVPFSFQAHANYELYRKQTENLLNGKAPDRSTRDILGPQ